MIRAVTKIAFPQNNESKALKLKKKKKKRSLADKLQKKTKSKFRESLALIRK